MKKAASLDSRGWRLGTTVGARDTLDDSRQLFLMGKNKKSLSPKRYDTATKGTLSSKSDDDEEEDRGESLPLITDKDGSRSLGAEPSEEVLDHDFVADNSSWDPVVGICAHVGGGISRAGSDDIASVTTARIKEDDSGNSSMSGAGSFDGDSLGGRTRSSSSDSKSEADVELTKVFERRRKMVHPAGKGGKQLCDDNFCEKVCCEYKSDIASFGEEEDACGLEEEEEEEGEEGEIMEGYSIIDSVENDHLRNGTHALRLSSSTPVHESSSSNNSSNSSHRLPIASETATSTHDARNSNASSNSTAAESSSETITNDPTIAYSCTETCGHPVYPTSCSPQRLPQNLPENTTKSFCHPDTQNIPLTPTFPQPQQSTLPGSNPSNASIACSSFSNTVSSPRFINSYQNNQPSSTISQSMSSSLSSPSLFQSESTTQEQMHPFQNPQLSALQTQQPPHQPLQPSSHDIHHHHHQNIQENGHPNSCSPHIIDTQTQNQTLQETEPRSTHNTQPSHPCSPNTCTQKNMEPVVYYHQNPHAPIYNDTNHAAGTHQQPTSISNDDDNSNNNHHEFQTPPPPQPSSTVSLPPNTQFTSTFFKSKPESAPLTKLPNEIQEDTLTIMVPVKSQQQQQQQQHQQHYPQHNYCTSGSTSVEDAQTHHPHQIPFGQCSVHYQPKHHPQPTPQNVWRYPNNNNNNNNNNNPNVCQSLSQQPPSSSYQQTPHPNLEQHSKPSSSSQSAIPPQHLPSSQSSNHVINASSSSPYQPPNQYPLPHHHPHYTHSHSHIPHHIPYLASDSEHPNQQQQQYACPPPPPPSNVLPPPPPHQHHHYPLPPPPHSQLPPYSTPTAVSPFQTHEPQISVRENQSMPDLNQTRQGCPTDGISPIALTMANTGDCFNGAISMSVGVSREGEAAPPGEGSGHDEFIPMRSLEEDTTGPGPSTNRSLSGKSLASNHFFQESITFNGQSKDCLLSKSSLPDYILLCIVATVINPLIGVFALLANRKAKQNYRRHQANTANNCYLLAILLSAVAVFTTVATIYTILVPTMMYQESSTISPVPKPTPYDTADCKGKLFGYDDTRQRFFNMSFELYCQITENAMVMDALNVYIGIRQDIYRQHNPKNKNSTSTSTEKERNKKIVNSKNNNNNDNDKKDNHNSNNINNNPGSGNGAKTGTTTSSVQQQHKRKKRTNNNSGLNLDSSFAGLASPPFDSPSGSDEEEDEMVKRSQQAAMDQCYKQLLKEERIRKNKLRGVTTDPDSSKSSTSQTQSAFSTDASRGETTTTSSSTALIQDYINQRTTSRIKNG